MNPRTLAAIRKFLSEDVEGGTLVIHLDDRSTDFLKKIYEGYGYPVISKHVPEQEMMAAIKSHSRLFMMGHGSPNGLFARQYMIGDQFGPAIAEKKSGLYIWCNADAYAKRNKLSGLVSGMFISEVGEARMFGIEATQEEVDASNDAFSITVRAMLDQGAPPHLVRQCYSNPTCKITKYNQERLYVFENGVPTPALHPSSMGVDRPPIKPVERSNSSQDWPMPRSKYDERFEEQMWYDDLEWAAYDSGLDVVALYKDEDALAIMDRCYKEGIPADECIEEILNARGESTQGFSEGQDDLAKLPLPANAKRYARRQGMGALQRQPLEFISVMATLTNQKGRQHGFANKDEVGKVPKAIKEDVDRVLGFLLT